MVLHIEFLRHSSEAAAVRNKRNCAMIVVLMFIGPCIIVIVEE